MHFLLDFFNLFVIFVINESIQVIITIAGDKKNEGNKS